MCNKNSNYLFYFTIISLLINIPTIILYFTLIRPSIILSNFKKGECNISLIEFPTYFPLDNNLTNWESCYCGKRCESITPCIKLYSSFNENNHIYDTLTSYITNVKCTFYDKKCKDGENPEVIIQNLHNSIDKSKSYVNKTIECYYDNDYKNIFIENNIDYISGYLLVIFIIILNLIYLYFLISYLRNKYRKKKEEQKQKKLELEFENRFIHLENLEYKI